MLRTATQRFGNSLTLHPCATTGPRLLFAQGPAVIICHCESLQLEGKFSDHTSHVVFLAVGPSRANGIPDCVASCDSESRIIVWDLPAKTQIASYQSREVVTALSWFHNNIVLGTAQGVITVLNSLTQTYFESSLDHNEAITAISPVSEDHRVAIGYRDGYLLVEVIRPESVGGLLVVSDPRKGGSPLGIIQISWNRTHSHWCGRDVFATLRKDGEIQVWDLPRDKETILYCSLLNVLRGSPQLSSSPMWMSWSKNGRVIRYSNGSAVSFDLTQAIGLNGFPCIDIGIEGTISAIATDDDGGNLLTVQAGNILSRYDINYSYMVVTRRLLEPLGTELAGISYASCELPLPEEFRTPQLTFSSAVSEDQFSGISSQPTHNTASDIFSSGAATISSTMSDWNVENENGRIIAARGGKSRDLGGSGKMNPVPLAPADEKYACPFFKNNPVAWADHPICRGHSWNSIHRLKEHLYRKHRQPDHICKRCHEAFESEHDLDSHQGNPDPCQLNLDRRIEGLSQTQIKQLRSRKRAPLERSESEKWRSIYKLIFPHVADDEIPSLFYEPRDMLSKIEGHINTEVPMLFRQHLGPLLRSNGHQVEETIENSLVELLRNLQLESFRNFRIKHQLSEVGATEADQQDQCRGTASMSGDSSQDVTHQSASALARFIAAFENPELS